MGASPAGFDPGGWLLAITGHQAWTGTQDDWLGGTARIWWSHADQATNRAWIQAAGLRVTAEEFVPEGDGGHALFWARRPGPRYGAGAQTLPG